MSKSSKMKKHNKALREAKQKRLNQISEYKKDIRFMSDKFLSREEEIELRMRQQGLI